MPGLPGAGIAGRCDYTCLPLSFQSAALMVGDFSFSHFCVVHLGTVHTNLDFKIYMEHEDYN